ncbi:MAG: tetratricopeptide repeat protein [Bacteroidota bacterium]
MEEKTFTDIETYLMGRMSEAEKSAFEQRLQVDNALAQEVRTQEMLIEQAMSLGVLEMKQKLRSIKKEMVAQHQRRIRRIVGLVAVGVALLLAILFFINQQGASIQVDKIYASHYQAYELTFGSRNTEELPQLSEVGKFYQDQSYDKALPLIETLLAEEPNNSRLLLAKGICQMELNEFAQAKLVFQQLIDKQDTFYFQQAQWYTALSCIRLDQLDAAKPYLQSLAQTDGAFKQEEATQILSELEE